MANSFRTKTGRCVLADGTVHFERDGAGRLGTVREALTTAEIPVWRRIAVVLFGIAVLAGGVLLVQTAPAWLSGVVAGLLLVLLGRSWYTARNRPDNDEVEIPKTDVSGVDPHAGIPLLTRQRFVVRYQSEGGIKHRYVQCPSRIYGFGSFEKGLDLFERHGLLVTEDSQQVTADS